jgi:hypothetical protein
VRDLLIRAVVAVPVAVLLPFGVAALRDRMWRGAAAAVLVLAAVAVHYDRWQAWLAVAVAAVAAAIPARYDAHRPLLPVALALGATVGAALVCGAGPAIDAVETAGESRDVVVVAAAGLACVFLGGALIGRVLHRFATLVEDPAGGVRGMEDAGLYIGWLERALLFAFLTAGSPEAAALVIAAKSVARFPSFEKDRFAEYYLIGSLMSLVIAVLCAGAARAAIGLALT